MILSLISLKHKAKYLDSRKLYIVNAVDLNQVVNCIPLTHKELDGYTPLDFSRGFFEEYLLRVVLSAAVSIVCFEY